LLILFSDLKHNQAALGKASKAEKKAFELAKPSARKAYVVRMSSFGVDLLEKFQVQVSRIVRLASERLQ